MVKPLETFIDEQISEFEKLESLKDTKKAFFESLSLNFEITVQALRDHGDIPKIYVEEFELGYSELMKVEPCGSGNQVYWTSATKQKLMDLIMPLKRIKTYLVEKATEGGQKGQRNWLIRIFEKGGESKWSMSNPVIYVPVAVLLVLVAIWLRC